MRKRSVLLLFVCMASGISFGDETGEKEGLSFIPMVSYSFISLEEQSLHIPGLGFGVMKGDGKYHENPDTWFLAALYTPYLFTRALESSYPRYYHQADFTFDKLKGRHQFLMIFSALSDKPVAGGLQTFVTGAAYGYAFLQSRTISLTLGAGLGAGDFGIDLPNGEPFPVMILPLVRFNFDSPWIAAYFEFIKGPYVSVTVAPKSRVRFTGEFRMDYYRSIEDLLAECALWYRFFDASHPLGDFMGVSLGFQNAGYSYALSERDKTFELQYRSVFACFDLSFLKLKGGYVFDSRTLYDQAKQGDPGKGWFISVNAMYQF